MITSICGPFHIAPQTFCVCVKKNNTSEQQYSLLLLKQHKQYLLCELHKCIL